MKGQEINKAADTIRQLVVTMVEKAKSGHPGGAMGGADFMAVLFTEFLQFDPNDAAWANRDRFFLDPGHMSPMLYATLSLFSKFTMVQDIVRANFLVSGQKLNWENKNQMNQNPIQPVWR